MTFENIETDTFTNYKFDEFESVNECINRKAYSYYCYALCKWGFENYFYLLRICNIEMIDNNMFFFLCPAYKLNEEMASRKEKVIEFNRLNLTPGKVELDLNDLPPIKLTHENSYYDAKLKRRVPLLDLSTPKDIAQQHKEKNLSKDKKPSQKIEDGMVNNTDKKFDNCLHSSDFYPPIVCTRLWVLNRCADVGWGWFMRTVDGYKLKYEYYCRPLELDGSEYHKQYDRGGDFFSFAYLRKTIPILDIEELSQENYMKVTSDLDKFKKESFDVVIDALLTKIFVKKIFDSTL